MFSQPDVEWDEQSHAEMLALHAYRRTRCPGCGGNLEETTAAENEDRYKHEPSLQCHRCEEFARTADEYRDHPHPHTFLHLVSLKRG